jgi:hypothetical protein
MRQALSCAATGVTATTPTSKTNIGPAMLLNISFIPSLSVFRPRHKVLPVPTTQTNEPQLQLNIFPILLGPSGRFWSAIRRESFSIDAMA